MARSVVDMRQAMGGPEGREFQRAGQGAKRMRQIGFNFGGLGAAIGQSTPLRFVRSGRLAMPKLGVHDAGRILLPDDSQRGSIDADGDVIAGTAHRYIAE